jgi:hypothetical protein
MTLGQIVHQIISLLGLCLYLGLPVWAGLRLRFVGAIWAAVYLWVYMYVKHEADIALLGGSIGNVTGAIALLIVPPFLLIYTLIVYGISTSIANLMRERLEKIRRAKQEREGVLSPPVPIAARARRTAVLNRLEIAALILLVLYPFALMQLPLIRKEMLVWRTSFQLHARLVNHQGVHLSAWRSNNVPPSFLRVPYHKAAIIPGARIARDWSQVEERYFTPSTGEQDPEIYLLVESRHHNGEAQLHKRLVAVAELRDDRKRHVETVAVRIPMLASGDVWTCTIPLRTPRTVALAKQGKLRFGKCYVASRHFPRSQGE